MYNHPAFDGIPRRFAHSDRRGFFNIDADRPTRASSERFTPTRDADTIPPSTGLLGPHSEPRSVTIGPAITGVFGPTWGGLVEAQGSGDVPANAITTDSGDAITTDAGDTVTKDNP